MRKSSVSDMPDEHATRILERILARMSATSRACRAYPWTLEKDTDTRTNGQLYTAADRRPTNQVG